jgi:hypothetical protein
MSDKDLFMQLYQDALARRLLSRKRAYDAGSGAGLGGGTRRWEDETHLVSLLKGQCGPAYTAKVEGMLKDLAMADDMSRAFEGCFVSVRDADPRLMLLTHYNKLLADSRQTVESNQALIREKQGELERAEVGEELVGACLQHLQTMRGTTDELQATNLAMAALIERYETALNSGMPILPDDAASIATFDSDLAVRFTRTCGWKAVLSQHPSFSLSVQVLSTGHWPAHLARSPVQATLPPEVAAAHGVFEDWYHARHNQCSLKWVVGLGDAVVAAKMGGGRVYEFHVGALQAIVLKAFDGVSTAVSFGDVQRVTGMHAEVLKRVLHSLCCQKLKLLEVHSYAQMQTLTKPQNLALTQSQSQSQSQSQPHTHSSDALSVFDKPSSSRDAPSKRVIADDDSFTVNMRFTHPFRRLFLPMPTLDELTRAASGATAAASSVQGLKESRGHVVEAAVVRVMKAHKVLAHAQLVVEVLTHVTAFVPDVKVIKQRVEHLIDRGYLERDESDSKLYVYVP